MSPEALRSVVATGTAFIKDGKVVPTKDLYKEPPQLNADAMALLVAHLEQGSKWLYAATDLRATFGWNVPEVLSFMSEALRTLRHHPDYNVALAATNMVAQHYNTERQARLPGT